MCKSEIIVINRFEKLSLGPDDIAIDTTSRANSDFSPFLLGPVKLPCSDEISKNMENAWQYSKVYEEFRSTYFPYDITSEYWNWRRTGFSKQFADRYPMGKGRKALFSVLKDGTRLTYIEARKQLYIPMYSDAVVKTKSFKELKTNYQNTKYNIIYLKDYDAYRHKDLNMSYEDVINNQNKKMGHAFVLAMLLEDYL